MKAFKRYIAVIFLNVIFIQAYSQTGLSSNHPIDIKSVTLDTIQVRRTAVRISALWLNDTIKVWVLKQNANSVEDSASLKNVKDIGNYISEEMAAQNCYSYALEKYFEHNELFNQDIFRKSSKIDRESLEKILHHSFKKIYAFSTKPRSNLKKPIPNDVILAFVNIDGWIIHTVYYRDKIFYSKNGLTKPIVFKSLNKFLKKYYWDTKEIIAYKFDADRIKSNYDNKGL